MVEAVTQTSATSYSAHPRYRIIALLCAALVALFAWELSQGFDLGSLFFLLLCLALCAWNVVAAATHVRLDGRGLTLRRPLQADRVIEFRQLAVVAVEGRWSRSILIHYHPLAEHPLVDLDSLHSLALPTVSNQDELLATLEKQTPA